MRIEIDRYNSCADPTKHCWPNGIEAKKLIVVGEHILDSEGSQYLETLHRLFSLPIEYRQVQL